MVRITASLVLAALASAAVAVPSVAESRSSKVHSIPISRPKKSSAVSKDFVAKEKTRLASFSEAAATSGTAPVVNADVSYIAATTIGSQTFNLIVDTGSSNTWVGADTKFKAGSATKTGGTVSVSYGSGSFNGDEYVDNVGLGDLTIPKQSVGVASSATGFDGVDGIIGFGPKDLTQDTVSNKNTVNTVMDNLHSQGVISKNVLGVSFAPEDGSSTDSANGSLDLGGTDSSKYSGDITYTPKTSTSPYSLYWGIDVDSISVGSTTASSSASAIVDTGTTLIYIPSAAYKKFLSATGGKTDSSSGLASFTKKPTEDFTITVAGTDFTLAPADYLVPTAQYSEFGLTSGTYYAWINDGGATAADVNFIIGQKFLEHFYSVFDTAESRVGFATAA